VSASPRGGVFSWLNFSAPSFDGVYPDLAEALSAAEGVGERAQGRRLKKKVFFIHFFVDYCLKQC